MTTIATTTSVQPDNSQVSTTTGEYQHQYNVTLIDGATAIGASATSPGVEIGRHGTLILELSIPAAPAGTNPTLDITIETSKDNGVTDAWRTLGTAFAQQTGQVTTPIRKAFPGADFFVRANVTIGGTNTPSFTPLLKGQAF